MRSTIWFPIVTVLTLVLGIRAVRAQDDYPMEKQAPLPVGTVINTQNWQQYKDYMPGWMKPKRATRRGFDVVADGGLR